MSTAAHEVFDRAPYRAPEADLSSGLEATPDKLFSAQGRVGVLRYNARMLQFLLVLLASFLLIGAGVSSENSFVMLLTGLPGAVAIVFSIVVMVYTSIKRLHDLGLNGWLYLIGLIPLIGAFWTLYYSFLPGKEGDNAYGARREATSTDKVIGIIGIVALALILVGSFMV